MKRHRLLIILALGLLTYSPPPAPAQTRGGGDAFLVTRVKVPATKADKPPSPARPGRQQAARRACPVGLGYTLYHRGFAGEPVRVTTSREFHRGDAVRLVVESNLDGYLYVFHTENDGPPRMIFPDARLSGGDNRIAGHVPYEVPSSREADPRFRWFSPTPWFYFDDPAATERLYLAVSKRPLPGVPTRKELGLWCKFATTAE